MQIVGSTVLFASQKHIPGNRTVHARKELAALAIAQLSDADREFLNSPEAKDAFRRELFGVRDG